jgi:hypothetical protein
MERRNKEAGRTKQQKQRKGRSSFFYVPAKTFYFYTFLLVYKREAQHPYNSWFSKLLCVYEESTGRSHA